jgi:hypothetical protein
MQTVDGGDFEAQVERAAPAWFRLPAGVHAELAGLWALNRLIVEEADAVRVPLERVGRLHRDLLAGVDTAVRHLTGQADGGGPVRDAVCAVVGYDCRATSALADVLWDALVYPGQLKP